MFNIKNINKKKTNLKIKNIRSIFFVFGLIVLTFTIFSATVFLTPYVIGANNDTVITRVNVTNQEPILYDVTITPSSIDLTAGSTYLVNCTGLVYDDNGWYDVNVSNATLYDSSEGYATTYDKNYRYFNSSCDCSTEISPTNASCTCLFSVEYYANNGTWQCNMTATDDFGLVTNRNSSYATINGFIAIDIPISEINYGNLSVTETSSEMRINFSNFGNLPINVSIRGYGGEDSANPSNSSLNCETGNISLSNERYSLNSGTSFADMLNLSNSSTQFTNLTVPSRTDDNNYGNDTNATFWKLYVESGVSGFCNGTLEFYAIESSI
jgi:hypothetical protein